MSKKLTEKDLKAIMQRRQKELGIKPDNTKRIGDNVPKKRRNVLPPKKLTRPKPTFENLDPVEYFKKRYSTKKKWLKRKPIAFCENFSWPQMKDIILFVGQNHVLPKEKFTLTEVDEIIYKKLAYYFTMNPAFMEGLENGIDLDKGILMIGPKGTGKTTAFRVMQDIIERTECSLKFEEFSCKAIARNYSSNGSQTLTKYVNRKVAYFTDFGAEPKNPRHFGEGCNTMSEILYERGERYKKFGAKTFLCSNMYNRGNTLTSLTKVLKEHYDPRTTDRIMAMSNFIAYDTPNKRY